MIYTAGVGSDFSKFRPLEFVDGRSGSESGSLAERSGF